MTPAGAPTVFVIDDDAAVRAAIQGLLKSVGLRSESFGTAQAFLRSKRPDGPSCLVLDVRLPGISGLDFQHELADEGIQIPIIFITGHGDIPMTVKAMKSGAVEFLTKPFRDQRNHHKDPSRARDEEDAGWITGGIGENGGEA